MSLPPVAIITASYAGDLERFELLCASIDRHLTGFTQHYVLVASHDMRRFARFASSRRQIIDEREILPRWLRPFPDPMSLFRRHIWLSLRTPPLRGWHVQQLRRIAIAAQLDETALFFCDSDVVFLRPFDLAALWQDGHLRLLKRPHALLDPDLAEQRAWSRHAGKALGLPPDPPSEADYIATAIAWRRESVLAMCERMQAVHGRHWIEVLAADRSFSECMVYGRFVDGILGGSGHFATERELCRVYWRGPALDRAGLSAFIAGMAEDQVAIGLQSFVGIEPEEIRRIAGLD